MNIHMYPCNRGTRNNVLARGYHEFHATEHGVCCRYCGARPQEEPPLVSNRVIGQCTVCGGNHTLSPEQAHPSYYQSQL